MTQHPMGSERRFADALLRQSFLAFTWRVFQTLHCEADSQFIPNWHVDAICHALDQVRLGQTKRQVITVPPRHLKSITAAIAFPAFLLGHKPSGKILVASYALDLARKHSDDFRTILASDWYQRVFPLTRIAPRGSRGEEIRTSLGGVRKAVSTGSSVTGFGADVLIVDDLLKAQDAVSETERERAKAYLDSALLTRFDDPSKGLVIAIQQRLHEDDPAGFLLSKGLYRHLNLPAIAERDEDISIGPGRLYRRDKGTALFPQRFDLATLERLRREIGSATFSMQYQQDPIAPEGSVLRWEWFGTYEERAQRDWFQFVVQSWDTGMSVDPNSDWSVCTTWGFREGRWHLLDLLRTRLDYPDLKRKVEALANHWRADTVLIEKAASGIPLLQDLFHTNRSRYRAVQPTLHKEVRFNAACAPIEAGTILLPREAAWLEDLRREIMGFPRSKYDDQVDSVSQFLNWASGPGFRRRQNGRERRFTMKRRS